MTPDRLVEFIPSILDWLHPDPMPEIACDAVAISDWFQKIRDRIATPASKQTETSVQISSLSNIWPRAPHIEATHCGLARAITAPQLKVAASTPVKFCNYTGHNPRGDFIPALSQCTQVAGHVIASNGELAFSRNDFTLTGPFPFRWKRYYRQSGEEDQGLGSGWRHTLSEHLQLPDASPGAAQKVLLNTADGRILAFDLPAIGHACFNRSERVYLLRQSLHSFRLSAFDEPDKIFRADGTGKSAPLCEIRDDYGNTLSVDYHNGRPTRIVSSWGTTLECHYADAQMVGISDTQGGDDVPLCEYDYDHEGHLVATRSAFGQERFNMHGGQINALTNLNIGHLRFAYDKLQRVNAVYLSEEAVQEVVAEDDCKMSWHLRWRSGTHTCIVSSPARHDIHWRFDRCGNLVESLQAERSQRWRYDIYRNLCHHVDSHGLNTLYRHDRYGRLLRRTRDQLHRHYIYDDDGRLIATGEMNGEAQARCWQYHYAENCSHPSVIIDPEKNPWKLERDERGQLRILTDPEKGRITLDWNAQLQLIGLAYGDQKFSWDYAPNGNVIRQSHTSGVRREWHYGKRGNLSSVVFGDHTFSITPDEYGRPCMVRYGEEVLLQWQYDGHGRVLRIQEYSMPALTLGYNGHGQLTTMGVEDQRYTWQYNHYGQLTNFEDGGVLQREWQYEIGGRLREFRDSDSHYYLKYNNRGQLKQVRNNSGQLCSFHFDLFGRLTQAANEQCNLRFRYDRRDLLIAEHQDFDSDNSPENLSINHSYDGRGWLKSSCSDSFKITVLFSAAGSLYGIDTNGAMTVRSELQAGDSNTDDGQFRELLSLGAHQVEKVYRQGALRQISLGNDLAWSTSQAAQSPESLLPRLALISPCSTHATGERDAHNNLVIGTRVSPNSTMEYRYQYDGWGRLYCVECADFKTWLRSDPFGRRLLKNSTHRRSGRQRRIAMHWSGIGLWSEITHLDDKRIHTHFLQHPITGTALARMELGDPGDQHVPDGGVSRRVFFVADDVGRLLALLQDADSPGDNTTRPTPLWRFEPAQKCADLTMTLCPGSFQGSLGVYDSETQLFYQDFRYFTPALIRDHYQSRLEPGKPMEGALGHLLQVAM